jgi:hypothetical protein
LVLPFSDFQTLGEEYAGIIQVDFRQRSLPSKFSRFLSIFFHSFGLLVTSSLLKRLEKLASSTRGAHKTSNAKVLNFLSKARQVCPLL